MNEKNECLYSEQQMQKKKKELIYKNCRKEEYKYSKKKNKSHDSQ